jgi:hypothetical protein
MIYCSVIGTTPMAATGAPLQERRLRSVARCPLKHPSRQCGVSLIRFLLLPQRFHRAHPRGAGEGTQAVSPTSVWRVLSQAGLLPKWNGKPSKKGTGFEQPLAVHQHWHIDVSYINISGRFTARLTEVGGGAKTTADSSEAGCVTPFVALSEAHPSSTTGRL